MKASLTGEQIAVINHQLPGHGRVLAGPGTGKSATAVALAERILNAHEPTPKVKFLTFTRAATHELAKKFSSSQASASDRPSTIHSFSISTLLRNPGCASFPEPLRIPDEYEYKTLVRPHLAKQCHVHVRKLDKLIAEMAAKWESLAPEQHPAVTAEERARFMGAWMQHRRVFGYSLLQELPDLFRCALRDHNDLAGTDYALLIVDEYQDLNACDLEVLRLLAIRGCSILAIGDDDQSIYSFRKAHPVGIRRFLQDYQTTHDYKLTICQRSARKILEWAHFVIQGDPQRETRSPLTSRDDAPEGIVGLLNFKGDKAEAQGVAALVTWLWKVKGVPPSEILVLSRTDRYGTFTKAIKEELSNRGIPISDPSLVETVLAESSNRRLLAILRLLVQSADSLAWWSLLSLQEHVGDAFIDYAFNTSIASTTTFAEAFLAAANADFAGAPSASRSAARALWQEVSSLLQAIELPTQEEGLAWGKWILDQIESGRLPNCSDQLKNLLIEIDGAVEANVELRRYLSQIHPLGVDLMRARSDGARFMTMTGSKGLTVRATIVVGVDNDLIPRPDVDPAEERRLLYVAMTRSRE